MASRTLSFVIVLLCALMSLTGCKKDDFVNETLEEVGVLATEMTEAVEKADDKRAGVAAARKVFDDKKGDLGDKLAELKTLRGFQVSEETQKKMATDLMKHVTAVEGLRIKLMAQTRKDSDLDADLDALLGDFRSLLLST